MRDSDRTLLSVLVLSVAAIAAALFAAQNAARIAFRPTPSAIAPAVPAPDAASPASDAAPAEDAAVRAVATDLRVPWEVVALPDGDLLVTERSGILRRIGRRPAEVVVPGVTEIGEGGLMGLALHPRFAENGLLYLCFTARRGLENRVVRYRLDPETFRLEDEKIVIGGIPASQYHNGGRIAFGPDGYLYVTTGDAGSGEASQDTSSLAGKILRIDEDGGTPPDNPFGTPVWSYGHRNPQGIAWDDRGRLWATEHGRSGAASGYDELNLIVKGGNYGWPTIQGDETRDAMLRPVAHSGPRETWAPAGLAWLDGRLYFAGLRGVSLYEATPSADGRSVALRSRFRAEYGRLRAVSVQGSGLLVTTSNTDGRGKPSADDDRVLRFPAATLR